MLGPDHPDTLTTRNNLAFAYQDAGRPGRGDRRCYEQTLADRERVLGPDHPDTLTTATTSPWPTGGRATSTEAIPLLERDPRRPERVLGPDHPDTLATPQQPRHRLRGRPGDSTEAIPLYERTLADRERVLGPDHPDTLTTPQQPRQRLPGRPGTRPRPSPLFERPSPTASGSSAPTTPTP